MRFYGDIQRIDEEQRMVWGYASTEQRAMDGLVITREAMSNALDDYMEYANVREMHQPSAVGRTDEAYVDEGGLYVGVKVVDDNAWKKVTERVYRAFSIGAKITSRDADDKTLVRGIKLIEISLVDRPSDPGAKFDVYHVAGEEDMTERTEQPTTTAVPVTHTEETATVAAGSEIGSTDRNSEAPTEAEGGQDTVAATSDAEDAERGADAPEIEGAEAPAAGAEVDPVAAAVEAARSAASDATAAVAALSRAAEPAPEPRPVPPCLAEGIERGMYSVSSLGEVLQSLAYIIFSAEYEAISEGDSSPVPAQLKESFKALAAAYKAMSDEELAELVACVEAPAQRTEVETEVARGADTEAGAAVEDLNRQITILTESNDTLMRTLGDVTTQVKALADEVKRLGDAPMPPKTATTSQAVLRSVDKSEDATGGRTVSSPDALSTDDIGRYLDTLSPEDKALALTRAALAQPMTVGR